VQTREVSRDRVERGREHSPLHPIKAPLFIGQGLPDTLVLPRAHKIYVDAMYNVSNASSGRTRATTTSASSSTRNRR
jgi:hypothetical protein